MRDINQEVVIVGQVEFEEGLDSDIGDGELGTCIDLGIELEGLIKRCNLEGGKRLSFFFLWFGELGGKSVIY